MFPAHLKKTTLAAVAAGALVLASVAGAQSGSTTPGSPSSGMSSGATTMPAMTPSKTETASSAFQKLDASNSGYVSRDAASKLSGFDTAFTNADKNKDGKLTQDEFNGAWSAYTGNAK